MKIEAKSDYHGVPLVKIRDLLRKNRDGFGGNWFCRQFGEQEGLGEKVLNRLGRDGYIKRNPICDGDFELTAKGQRLASATAARRVKRATTTRALGKMLERVAEVNGDPDYLYRITDIKIFGDFLSEADKLSDVDLCVTLMPKLTGIEFDKKSKARIDDEIKKGRRFRNISEQVAWPRRRVLDHLRGKEGRLSIVDDGEGILDDIEWQFVYKIESGTNVDRFPELIGPED